MADLAITGTTPTASSRLKSGTAGEALSDGDLLYLKSTDNRYWRAEAGGTEEESKAVAVATMDAIAGGKVGFAEVGGSITIVGATFDTARTYVVSTNAGKWAPFNDLVSTNWVQMVAVPITTTSAELLFWSPGFQKA